MQILRSPDQRLADVVSRSASEIRCVYGVHICFFSKRHKEKTEIAVWETETTEDLLAKLRAHENVREMLDAVVVDSHYQLKNCPGQAMKYLRDGDKVEIFEDVYKVYLRIVSDNALRNEKRSLYVTRNATSETILRELDLGESMILHEGSPYNKEFLGMYVQDQEGGGATLVANESGTEHLSLTKQRCKAMQIVTTKVPYSNLLGVPHLTVIKNMKYYILDDGLVLERKTYPNNSLSYKAMLYGIVLRRAAQRTPTFYYRTEGGYITIYDDLFHKSRNEFAKMSGKWNPFILLISEAETVTDELLIAKHGNNCRKIKVWILYGNIWLQRVIPYRACRHFIPK